jgi:large subunit ribosomal protein L15
MPLLKLKSKIRQKRKRVGRGDGSGKGTYCTRGMKGQSARSGGRRRPGFEGGQTPYLRKMPKLKGFKNPNYIKYQIINTGQLNIFDDKATITKKELLAKNLISKKSLPIKLLGGKGELEKSLTIKVDKASASAIKAVESQKGKIILPKIAEKSESKTQKSKGKPEKQEKAEAKSEKKSTKPVSKPTPSK